MELVVFHFQQRTVRYLFIKLSKIRFV